MYESFFGLTGLPFRLIPDPSFLFGGKSHRDGLAALQAGLAAGARVMVLTGEVGAGKTTLLQALLATVDPASTVTAHISAAQLDAETLSDRLCEALGLPRQPDPLARRDALLTRLGSDPRATLLVIDEAQHLAPSAFDLLETMASATAMAPARLQICLVGQPALRILLNAAQRSGFRELIGVDRHLGPLEQAEIRLYVEHRLHRAGWAGRPEFEDAAFPEIFIFTAGNPRRVNLLCNSLLLCACLKRQQRIDAPAVTWAAAAMEEGAPDLLEVGSHFEHPPTLTKAFEPGAPELEAAAGREDTPAWSCPNCGGVNAATATECWNCDAARPSLEAAEESPSDTIRRSDDTVTAPPDEVHVDDATSAHAAMPQRASSARHRRQAILASAASVAVALALIAYVADRQGPHTSLSQNGLPDIAANRTKAADSPAPTLDPQRRAVGSVSPASSAESSAVPDAADAAPERAAPASPAAPGTPTPPCSGPAFALGLCDADSSTTRR